MQLVIMIFFFFFLKVSSGEGGGGVGTWNDVLHCKKILLLLGYYFNPKLHSIIENNRQVALKVYFSFV